MKRTLTALTTAAVLTVAAGAASAQGMSQLLNSLTGQVYNDLTRMQMDSTGIQQLTLGDVNLIANIMASGDSESEMKAQIDRILRNARGR